MEKDRHQEASSRRKMACMLGLLLGVIGTPICIAANLVFLYCFAVIVVEIKAQQWGGAFFLDPIYLIIGVPFIMASIIVSWWGIAGRSVRFIGFVFILLGCIVFTYLSVNIYIYFVVLRWIFFDISGQIFIMAMLFLIGGSISFISAFLASIVPWVIWKKKFAR